MLLISFSYRFLLVKFLAGFMGNDVTYINNLEAALKTSLEENMHLLHQNISS